MRLVRRAVQHSGEARGQVQDEWPAAIDQLLRLLVSPAPHAVKAEIMRTLAAFAADPNIAAYLWSAMEAANVLQGYVMC